ncbi:permease of the major facilitator superfamily [Mycena albidolilacea]|uniref:Permease of the major facilitator superfamily n=1 Tax=Mycena albidolilacea TaxID=1033008 RepID=A0AAD6ZU53_9AGAR|nr:permease of the major facilitator superfamily [Mycena albidolilacea]
MSDDEEKKTVGSIGDGELTLPSKESVFDDSVLSSFYTPPDSYEGKHRWDPHAVWTAEEEAAIVRKINVRIMFSRLDRGNLSNALSDNFLADVGNNTEDYNLGSSVFFITFLLMEIPSQLISKRVGVEVWVLTQMIIWSVIAIFQAKVTGRASFLATRALLGVFEGGFIPDMVLYLSYWYTVSELTIRLSFFWAGTTLTSIFGSLMASGILEITGHGWKGWQYLFVIEGVLTLAFGVFALFYLPPAPTQTGSRFRGKLGWFTKREETIMVTRVLRDDPAKSDMHNRQALSACQMWQALTDYDLYPLYASWLLILLFTVTLKSLGFSTFNTNLLTISSSFVSMLLILFIALVTILDSTPPWSKYAILSILIADPNCQSIMVSLCSLNSGSVRTRSLSASIFNMMGQLSTGGQAVLPCGNRVLIGIVAMEIFLFILTKIYYIKRNEWKERKWSAMAVEERKDYLANSLDWGNKRLDFRFSH